MRTVLLSVALLAGCSASGAPNDPASGSGSGADSASGGGGSGGHGGDWSGGASGDGGDGGGGGQPPDEEHAEPGVEHAASPGYVARELACAGNDLYWFNETTRKVMRLFGGVETDAFTVDGEGDVMVRPAGDRVMVSLLGDSGAVWLVGVDVVEHVADGPVVYAAFGHGLPHWYDGQSIRTQAGVVATPDGKVVAFGVYDDGPVFLTDDNSIYIMNDGATDRIGEAPSGYYPDTFTIAGATAAWGSVDGMRVVLLDGSSMFAFGGDVRVVSTGPSGLFMCEHGGDDDRIAHLEPTGKLVTVAKHKTCVSLTECSGTLYWSTASGSILRVPLHVN